MRKIKPLLTSKTDNWKTPKKIYDEFMKLDYFDPCPYNEGLIINDGLKIEWKERNFVNPPYSQLKKWVIKSIEEHKKNKIVYLLIPARTDTQAFKLLVNYGCFIKFYTGRLHFNDSKDSAPFPSCLIRLNGNGKVNCYWGE